MDEYITRTLDNGTKVKVKVLKYSKTLGGPIISDDKEIAAGTCYVMKSPNPFKKLNTSGFGHSDNPYNPDNY